MAKGIGMIKKKRREQITARIKVINSAMLSTKLSMNSGSRFHGCQVHQVKKYIGKNTWFSGILMIDQTKRGNGQMFQKTYTMGWVSIIINLIIIF